MTKAADTARKLKRVATERPESLIVVAGLVVGLLLLPVRWRFGILTLGMSVDTRAALAAGALTSVVVAGALAVFEHRRLEDRRAEQGRLHRQTTRLADASVVRLLRAIAHGYRLAVTNVALRLEQDDRVDAATLGWSQTDLGALAKALVWFTTLGIPDPGERRSDDGRDSMGDLVLGVHLGADVLVAGKEAGLVDEVPDINVELAVEVAEGREELARLADALLLQNAPDDAAPLLALRADIDRMWRVADRHLPWGADLAETLVGWLTQKDEGWSRSDVIRRLQLEAGPDVGAPLTGEVCRTWLDRRTDELLSGVAEAVNRQG